MVKLNLVKTQIEKMSEVELEKINLVVQSHTKTNQWRNTTYVINWFQNLTN